MAEERKRRWLWRPLLRATHRFASSVNNWQTLQMPASQQHVSTAPCTGTCSPHNSVAQDEATYGDRWRAMLGTP